jgi:homoserine O-acetyltransferase/O-succinyltransferase
MMPDYLQTIRARAGDARIIERSIGESRRIPERQAPRASRVPELIPPELIIRAIRNDPGWHEGEYDPAHPPTVWMQTAVPLSMVMASNPENLQAAGPDRARTLAFYDQLVAQYYGRDPNDYLYDFESSRDYDPATDVNRIKAPMLAINFADDQINPTQFAITQQTVARLPSSRLIVMPGGDAGNGQYRDLPRRDLGEGTGNIFG